MNTKIKKLLYLLFLCFTPLQAAEEEIGTTKNGQSYIPTPMYQEEEKKEDPEDNLQNDPPFDAYSSILVFNQQQEKPIVDPLDHTSGVQNQPIDSFEITQCIQQTRNNFNKFLDQYADSFTGTIRVCFQKLSNHSSSNLEEISDFVESLTDCFETLQTISTRTPNVLKKLFGSDNPLTAAQNKLQNLSKEIKKTIKKEKQLTSPSLNHTLQVVEYLTDLDEYLPEKNKLTFTQLYQDNSQAFYSDVIELPKVQDNMEKEKYKEVAQSMKELLQIMKESSNDMRAKKALEIIQRTVEQDLKKRIKAIRRTTMLSQSEVKEKAIFDLQNELTVLDNAMEAFCPKDCNLLDKSSQKELIRQKKLAYKSLADWMQELITKIKTLIYSFDFLGAEEHIQKLKKINQILGENMIEADENDKNMNLHKEIVNKIKEVEDEIQKKLQAQVDYYEKITLDNEKYNPYITQPPKEFCEKLKAAKNKHGRYSEANSYIQRDIFQKVRKLMMKGLKNPLLAQEKFNLCRNVLTSLPKEWSKALEREIDQEWEKVEELKKLEANRIDNMIKISLTDDRYKLLRELKIKGDTNNALKVGESIRTESESKYNSIKGYIHEGNIQQACFLLTELYRDKCLYSDQCPFIQEHHENARSELSIALKTKTDFLKEHLSSDKENDKLTMEKMRTYLNQIQQFESYCAQLNK